MITKIKNKMKFVFIFLISSNAFLQESNVLSRIVFYERENMPVKNVVIIVKNHNDSVVERTLSDKNGFFQIVTNIAEIKKIETYHPLSDSVVIYKDRFHQTLLSDSIFKFYIFDYTSNKRDECILYDDIQTFISKKNSKYLDLNSKKITHIPCLKKLKRHGAEAIFLENNNLQTLPKKLFKVKKIKYIDLTNNPIDSKSIKFIEKSIKRGVLIIYDKPDD
jgi:hypothetical protein